MLPSVRHSYRLVTHSNPRVLQKLGDIMLNREVHNLDNTIIITELQSSPSALDSVSKFGSLARVLGTTDSQLRSKWRLPQDCLYQVRSSPPLIDTTHSLPSKHETSDTAASFCGRALKNHRDMQPKQTELEATQTHSFPGRAVNKHTHTSYDSAGGLSGTPSGELS